MANLTEEEKEILYRAHEIKERLRAEELEAGEISLEEAERQAREEMGQPKRSKAEPLEDTGEHPGIDFAWEEDASRQIASGYSEPGSDRKQKRRREEKRQAKRDRKREAATARMPARPKKKRRWLRRLIAVLAVFILLAALLVLAAYIVIRAKITATNYQPYETAYVRAEDVAHDSMVTNILLIGTDNRVADDASRSDAMIVLSVNRRKGRLVMTSILRDSYVNIPGYGQNRINHSYQMGGAPLLIQTIEENFKIGIDYYVQVDFYDFIEVIDAFGGVDIEVTPEELVYVNGYVSEINHYEGKEEGYSFLNEAGYQTLNGRQALGYSRIRIIGTDFARTGRQRTVLNALIQKAKSNPLKILAACNSILPDLTTNINDDEMAKLLISAPLYLLYSMNQFQVPVDGFWWNTTMDNGQEVLGIDFTGNNEQLRSAIYD